MWPSRHKRLAELQAGFERFSRLDTRLVGVEAKVARETLGKQMISSLRRLDYTVILKRRDVARERIDPANDMFDPERAAIFHARADDIDEAIWLVFLSIQFGKHGKHGWR